MNLKTKVALAVLAGLWFSTPKLIPSGELTGTIVELSPVIAEPIASQNALILLPEKRVTAQIYEMHNGFKIGDMVIVREDERTGQFIVADFARTVELVRLLIIFLFLVVLVSGIAGLRSLFGLIFSFAVIFAFVLPQIMAGTNPLIVTLIASLGTIFVSYYLTHGVSAKTTIAIVGTFGSLIITGIMALLYVKATRLSGFGSEEATFLLAELPTGSMQNLLLAGIIIATLGILDDVTISQASVVKELAIANPRLSRWELFGSAMRVGRDHIASVVNTLVLVYAGSALPLLLLFVTSSASVLELLNYEAVAEEVVRTLVGSIGLISAVPLTTLVAAIWYTENSVTKDEHKSYTKTKAK